MLKLFLNYLICLSILLYSGSCRLIASNTSQSNLTTTTQVEFSINTLNLKNIDCGVIYESTYSADNGYVIIVTNELKDEDFVSLVKLIKSYNFFTLNFDVFSFTDLSNLNCNFSKIYTDLSCCSSGKNVLFQVFRI